MNIFPDRPPVVPPLTVSFLVGRVQPYQNRLQTKVGVIILTSLLEDLVPDRPVGVFLFKAGPAKMGSKCHFGVSLKAPTKRYPQK